MKLTAKSASGRPGASPSRLLPADSFSVCPKTFLSVEETFGIELSDDESSLAVTVGDLYRLVLDKLRLRYVPPEAIEASGLGRDRSRLKSPGMLPWSADDVWITLRAVVQDQLQVNPEDIKESAAFVRDFGCD